ncbi:MAG: cardiolipin synthase [Epulopiscium sp. Nele67-Bin005]|nr:MAG: cardiolipin synthase [Epulopiscium sp. Nele67-Bin005]
MFKKINKMLFSRNFAMAMLVLFQMVLLVGVILRLTEYFVYLYAVFMIISLVMVIIIVNRTDNPAYKLTWIIFISIFPLVGGISYLLFGGKQVTTNFRKKVQTVMDQTLDLARQDQQILDELEAQDKSIYNQANYIYRHSLSPIYKNTETEFLPSGEIYFERLKEELRKAKHFIFMEYFIVDQGSMWDEIVEIMAEKAQAGLDVRMMYDDGGTILLLPFKYNEYLESFGIKTVIFNKMKPILSMRMNNRDHRKISVIDGYVGFTGGVNLADEYINKIERFGHWKDAGICLKGDAVWNLTMMFLQIWNFATNTYETDFDKYKPHTYYKEAFANDGYVQPYGDSPLDDEIVGENVYLNIINRAKDYVYISTPYLIIDNELVTALTLAAKSGVDIRIMTPHIEDKWYAHTLTRSHYGQLILAGVKIYEYTPGFVHSKTFVSDDEIGVVGTINMDYRSLYLHFECAVWLYKSKAVLQIKDDFLQSLEVCQEIYLEDTYNVKLATRIIRALLKILAPIM